MSAVAFDHESPGTSEAVWAPALRRLPPLDPAALSPPVVVVSPHPDDEVLAVGGLLQALEATRVPVRLLSLTDGEGADRANPLLGGMRRAELAEALDRLGLTRLEVVHAGLPDGHLGEMPVPLRRVLEGVGPVGTWIAPIAHDGHPDHEAAGRAVAEVAARDGVTLLRFAVWAWHWGAPADLPWDRGMAFHLDDAAHERKGAAISAFRSQVTGTSPIVGRHMRAHFERRSEVLFT